MKTKVYYALILALLGLVGFLLLFRLYKFNKSIEPKPQVVTPTLPSQAPSPLASPKK